MGQDLSVQLTAYIGFSKEKKYALRNTLILQSLFFGNTLKNVKVSYEGTP